MLFAIVFIVVVVGVDIFQFLLAYINIRYSTSGKAKIPELYKDTVTVDEFDRSKRYLKERWNLSRISTALDFVLGLYFIFFGFKQIEALSLNVSDFYIWKGLFFFAFYGIIMFLIHLPFGLYRIFRIEESYGFNKTTPKLYIIDTIKSMLLSVVFGGLLGAGSLWIIYNLDNWWLPLSIAIIVVQFIAMWFVPKFIMPLFNKFTPLENEELKARIFEIAEKAGFGVSGIFVMDASRRSKHSNAFFTGSGKNKKIVLFDTLLNDHDDDEIVAIFAHEVGHYAHKDIHYGRIESSLLLVGLTFLLWLLSSTSLITNAFGVSEKYAVLTYAIIFISAIFSLGNFFFSSMSRKREFRADAYSAKITGDTHAMIKALKRLSKVNLSNLNPHPLYAKFNYTHPTPVERIKALTGDR